MDSPLETMLKLLLTSKWLLLNKGSLSLIISTVSEFGLLGGKGLKGINDTRQIEHISIFSIFSFSWSLGVIKITISLIC